MHSRIFQLSIDNPLEKKDYITETDCIMSDCTSFSDYIVDLDSVEVYDDSIAWFGALENITVDEDSKGFKYFTSDAATLLTLEKVFMQEIADLRLLTQDVTRDLRAGKAIHLASRIRSIISELCEFRYVITDYNEGEFGTREDLYNFLCNHKGRKIYFAGILDYHF